MPHLRRLAGVTLSLALGIAATFGADPAFAASPVVPASVVVSSVSITFDANGGSGAPSSVTVTPPGAAAIPNDTPYRDGYSFVRWNTSADGSGTSVNPGGSYSPPADTVLYAQWSALESVVGYDPGGSTDDTAELGGSMSPTWGVTDGVVVLPDNGYTYAGHTFSHWNTSPDGSGTSYSPGALYRLPALFSILYAQWVANGSVTLTYVANPPASAQASGSTSSSTVISGVRATVAGSGFSVAGYAFTGWNSAADGSGTSYFGGDTLRMTADATLYAQWSGLPATLSYDGNGATSGTVGTTSGVTGDGVEVQGNSFVRTGYDFAGWNTAADGSGQPYYSGGSYALPAGASTLYAQWTLAFAVLHYDGNGATSGETYPDVAYFGDVVHAVENEFISPGYKFSQWNTSADGSGTSYSVGASYTLGAGIQTLYAQWAPNAAVSTTLNANGGASATTDPVTIASLSGQTVTLDSHGIARPGYTLASWNTSADGSGISFAYRESVTVTADSVLYAQWEANPSVSLSYEGNAANAEGGVGSETVLSGQTVALAASGYTRVGFIFSGWNTQPSGSGSAYAAGDVVTLTSDVTLYAQWSPITYAITYNLDGGVNAASNPVSFNVISQTITLADPSRAGYAFSGWTGGGVTSPARGLQVVAGSMGDVAFTAHWSKLVVTVSAKPVVTGTLNVGQTLSVTSGSWSPGPVDVSYQWQRNGASIAKATGARYTLVAADKGKTISIRVTASRANYTAGTATVGVAKTIGSMLSVTRTKAPKVSGSGKVGTKLRVTSGSWSVAGAKVSYRWYRAGKAISRATASTYTLTKADKGKKITVKVTAAKTGYVSGTTTLVAAKKVAAK